MPFDKKKIPDNKYIAICKGEIIMVGESPSELAQKIIKANIHDSVHIKFTGPNQKMQSILDLPENMTYDQYLKMKELQKDYI